jgi:hypothetical protein
MLPIQNRSLGGSNRATSTWTAPSFQLVLVNTNQRFILVIPTATAVDGQNTQLAVDYIATHDHRATLLSIRNGTAAFGGQATSLFNLCFSAQGY